MDITGHNARGSRGDWVEAGLSEAPVSLALGKQSCGTPLCQVTTLVGSRIKGPLLKLHGPKRLTAESSQEPQLPGGHTAQHQRGSMP